VELKIPADSDAGRKLRLRGRGLPGSPDGDQIVEIEIVAPAATDEAQKKAYLNGKPLVRLSDWLKEEEHLTSEQDEAISAVMEKLDAEKYVAKKSGRVAAKAKSGASKKGSDEDDDVDVEDDDDDDVEELEPDDVLVPDDFRRGADTAA